MKNARKALLGAAMFSLANVASGVTLDFTTDDFGTALINGQSIYSFVRVDNASPFVPFSSDNVLEFGNLVNISDRIIGSDGHLGPAIFDSDPTGPNQFSQDPDLLIDQGNILILQNDGASGNNGGGGANGLVFTSPNDEADASDRGAIVFDFLNSVELFSIDLVDINGGNNVILTLTDGGGLEREYDVSALWTVNGGVGLLDLTALGVQVGPGGGTATETTQAGFNPLDVRQLDVALVGGPASGGLDNLTFTVVPIPAAVWLFGSGVFGLVAISRRKKVS